MKRCELCDTEFEPAKPWATFCSERCRIRAFRQRKREAKPTYEFEQALLAAVRQLRAGEARVAVATARAALDKFKPPPKPRRKRIATEAKARKKRKATDGSTAQRETAKKKRVKATARKRIATQEDALLVRYERALAAGVKPVEVARAIGLPNSTLLGRWRKGGKLPAARAEALVRWLNDGGHLASLEADTETVREGHLVALA